MLTTAMALKMYMCRDDTELGGEEQDQMTMTIIVRMIPILVMMFEGSERTDGSSWSLMTTVARSTRQAV